MTAESAIHGGSRAAAHRSRRADTPAHELHGQRRRRMASLCRPARAAGQGHAGALGWRVGGAGRPQRARTQEALADLPLATFLSQALVPYEADAVTRLIIG